MTCDEHERLAIESTRGGAFPPDTREHAREHAANCPRCASQVAQHATVSRALRALAAEDASLRASPEVEAAVRAAWRARTGDVAQAVDGRGGRAPTTVRAMVGRVTVARAAIGLTTAAALALAVLMLPDSQGPDSELQALAPRAPAAPTRATGGGASSAGVAGTVSSPVRERGARPPSRSSAVSRVAAARGTTRVTETTHRDAPRSTARVVPAEAPVPAVRAAFVALPYVEPPGPTEMWQIVRVTMRSEAVVKAGLSARGLGPSIVADLLVGEDGITRAIRVVDDSRGLAERLPQEN